MIFDNREEVFVSVIAGKLEGVLVGMFSIVGMFSTCRFVAEEEAVEEVRVLSGEGRPRARRTRSFSAIVCMCEI